MSDVKLSAKQLKFCNEYLIDLNACHAAIRAGYSKNTAKVIGYENLTKPYLVEKIQELQQELQKSCNITPKSVIEELAKIGFSNIQDFVNGGNSILELKHLDRKIVAAVSSVETEVTEIEGNQFKPGKTTTITKIRLHDKRAALVDLGKHLGIFKEDNKQKQAIIKNVGFGGSED